MGESTSMRESIGIPICDQSTFNLSSSIDDWSSTIPATCTTDPQNPPQESGGQLVDFLSQNNPSSGDPHIRLGQGFCNAIKFAFREVGIPPDGIVQFWSPVQKGSRRVLTTDGQPFVFNQLDRSLEKYRVCSINYHYNIDPDKLEVQEHSTILKGAPANAFLNCSGEVVLDRRVHPVSPLARSALECELMSFFVLPISHPPETCCVGVIEYCAKEFDSLLKFFDYWVYALQKAGLGTFHVREHSSYKTLGGLKSATDEIEGALHIVCESHYITLAQVSVAYDDKNHEPFSYSFEDTHTKRTIALKLIGPCFDLNNEDLLSFKDYYGMCDMLPLGIGEGLATKALQSYEPRFCRNIYNVSNKELAALCPNTMIRKHSCFVICLRSSETIDRDYVFEFLWLQNRNWCILLEALILTLKRCLPNFKLSSGAELGDELLVLDVGNSSERKINYLKIFQGKKLSPMPKISEKDSRLAAEKSIAPLQPKYKTQKIELLPEDIRKHFGKTMDQAAYDLSVCVSTLKRKCKEGGIYEWEGPTAVKKKKNIGEYNPEIRGSLAEDTHLTFKAEYEHNMVKLRLPISLATFRAIEKEISKKFKLRLGSFDVKYGDDEEDLILLGSDQDIIDCIKSSKNVNGTSIKLFVLRSI